MLILCTSPNSPKHGTFTRILDTNDILDAIISKSHVLYLHDGLTFTGTLCNNIMLYSE